MPHDGYTGMNHPDIPGLADMRRVVAKCIALKRRIVGYSLPLYPAIDIPGDRTRRDKGIGAIKPGPIVALPKSLSSP